MATHTPALLAPRPGIPVPADAPPSWRDAPPRLVGRRAVLRELVPADAPDLFAIVGDPEVARFISAPPQTADALAGFIDWGLSRRRAGEYVGFALVPRGSERPAGLVQVRQLEAGFRTAEWGIALAPPFWGRGYFQEGAQLLCEFAFETLSVHRLEARAACGNTRGQVAMHKLGAVLEGVLRRSLVTADGSVHDQALWSVLAEDWRRRHEAATALVH